MRIKKILFASFAALFLFTPFLSVGMEEPIKILLVPGHDDKVWGCQYGNLKEADMNRVLAGKIYDLLKKDERFKTYITRDSEGYTKEFADYFTSERDTILSFKEQAKKDTQLMIENGDFIEKENVQHNSVSEDTSVILYGINKWASEHEIDLVVHVHFNDYPRPTIWTQGKYKGLAVYMPDMQLANSLESGKLAANILLELKKKYITSTYLKEKGGLVADQNLIALGSNNTLLPSVRSVLIEYGYIYRFGNSVARHRAYIEMANYTVAGIKNYFFSR